MDNDHDGDGFTNWQEHLAGTNLNDANSLPGFDFGRLDIGLLMEMRPICREMKIMVQ